jgi:hypothetical protein
MPDKVFFIRMKSLSNLACEVQEIKAVDAHRAFLLAAGTVAANWGKGNGSEAVSWWLEGFSGNRIGEGRWEAKEVMTCESSAAL